MTDKIKLLAQRLNGQPIPRSDELAVTCPVCGKESSPKDVHCSVGEKGWYCFVCGNGGSLASLVKLLDLDWELPERPQSPKVVMPQPRPHYLEPSVSESFLRTWRTAPGLDQAWKSYKPLSSEMIVKMGLGLGQLPASRCNHQRLIVPILGEDGQLVGVRGRRLGCDCPKWLASKGFSLGRVPAPYGYNLASAGDILFITENPIDAVLLTEKYQGASGLASFSTSYWTEAWTQRLLELEPQAVIVAYDNDLPGNGGADKRQELIAAWPGPRVPPSKGAELGNKLIKAGLSARLFDWTGYPAGADIGSLISGAEERDDA